MGTGKSSMPTWCVQRLSLLQRKLFLQKASLLMTSIACCSQIQSMQVVIEALHDLNMPLPPSLQEKAALIMSTRVSAHDPCPPMLDPAVTNALVALWADPTTKA